MAVPNPLMRKAGSFSRQEIEPSLSQQSRIDNGARNPVTTVKNPRSYFEPLEYLHSCSRPDYLHLLQELPPVIM